MAALADLLIPAGSALVGALIGSAGTIGSQIVTNRGVHKREQEARRDAFMSRRYEIERDTLLALQDAFTKHSVTWSSYINGELPPEARATDFDVLGDWREVVKLAARTLDREAADAATKYCEVAHRAMNDPHGERENLIEAFGRAQQIVGGALRRNPYAESLDVRPEAGPRLRIVKRTRGARSAS
jgi:hypothetical protein